MPQRRARAVPARRMASAEAGPSGDRSNWAAVRGAFILKVDESELEAAQFLGLQEYLGQPCWKQSNTVGTIYREHINKVIELYKKENYQGLKTAVGSGHTIYTTTR